MSRKAIDRIKKEKNQYLYFLLYYHNKICDHGLLEVCSNVLFFNLQLYLPSDK